MFFTQFVAAIALFFWAVVPASARTILVDFTEATVTVVETDGTILYQSKAVLPRKDYYALPVSGVVKNATMGPAWKPTPRMLRDTSKNLKPYYKPYEKGNAMGSCKVTIRFDQSEDILKNVRIHGHAKDTDLGKRLSSGCIRTPDALCQELVAAITESAEPVRVRFDY